MNSMKKLIHCSGILCCSVSMFGTQEQFPTVSCTQFCEEVNMKFLVLYYILLLINVQNVTARARAPDFIVHMVLTVKLSWTCTDT